MRKLRILVIVFLLVLSAMLSACSLPGFDQIDQAKSDNDIEDEPEVVNYDPVGVWVTYTINGLNWIIWQYFRFDEDHSIYYKNEATRRDGTKVNFFAEEYNYPEYTYYGQWTTTETTLTMMIRGEYYTYNIITNIAGTPGTGFYVNRPNSDDSDYYHGVIFLGGQSSVLFMITNISDKNESDESENEIML